jgi:hypothetical protein
MLRTIIQAAIRPPRGPGLPTVFRAYVNADTKPS